MRCQYCDTEYAFYGGEWMSFDEILDDVKGYDCSYVCVTGGEPLAQKRCPEFLSRLCDQGYKVSLETSGAMDVSVVDTRVVRVLDLKTPGSGEMQRNRMDNLKLLSETDKVKFVICSREDYEWAKTTTVEHSITDKCEVLFSPSFEELDAKTLAEWVLEDRIPVRVQVQLHKILWGDEPGR